MITKIERFDSEIEFAKQGNIPEVIMEECRLGDYVKYSDVNKILCEIRALCEHETSNWIAKHITDLLIRK